MQTKPPYVYLLCWLPLLVLAPAGHADNPGLQNLFFAACATATGQLSDRCAETNGGLGDLSSDSESSLNPSQSLAASAASIFDIGNNPTSVQQHASDGAWSWMLNVSQSTSEYDRRVDIDQERGWEMDKRQLDTGVDYAVNEHLNIGMWLHYEQATLDFEREQPGINFSPASNAGSTDTDKIGGTFYLAGQINENAYIDASFSIYALDLDTRRRSIFQESNRTVPQTLALNSGSTDGQMFVTSLGAGYTLPAGAWSITPAISLTHVATRIDDYVERDVSGAGLAMHIDSADEWVTTGSVGLTVSRAYSISGGVLMPQLRMQYLTDLSREAGATTVAFVNDAAANQLQLQGDGDNISKVQFAAGIVALFRHNFTVFFELQHVADANDFSQTQFAAGLRHTF